VKKYSPAIFGITFLLLFGCDLARDSYHPKKILGYPSPSESTIQWGDNTAKVTAEILSVDVECVPARGGKTGIEYEIAATAHISYQIIDRKFFKKATAFSDLEANLIFEPVTAPGSRLAIVRGVVRLIENADTTTTSVKISGFSAEELKRVVGVQARWE
jgi:hypothetical protein